MEWRWPRASQEADAGGALGAGPGVSEVAGAREVQDSRAWHDDATLAVLGGAGGLTLLLDGVKFMFFLWK